MSGELEDSGDLGEVSNADDVDVAASDKEQALSEKGRVAIGIDARRRVELKLEEARMRRQAEAYDLDEGFD
ncbi:MAG: hypothetical protein NZ730_01300 [Porticoccaceae bacterium]|nr:hypothetical protein [Porticoccaceae bacterium]